MKVLRLRTLIRHISPTSRQICEEITVRNDGEATSKLLNLEAPVYRPGRTAYDDDGTVLSILPNSMIRETLEKEGSAESRALLDQLNAGKVFVTPIVLPEDRGIAPGGVRTVKLEYADTTRPTTEMTTFFSTPRYKIEGNLVGEIGPVNHILVFPPPDFDLGLASIDAWKVDAAGAKYHLTDKDHHRKTVSSGIIDVAVPVTPEGTHYLVDYAIRLGNEESWMFGGFWFGAFGSSFLLLLLGIGTPPVVPGLSAHFVGIGGVILALCVGFIGLVTNPLTHRTKLWMAIPIVIAGIMVVIGYGG